MAEPTTVPENKRLVVAVCYVFPLIGGIILFIIHEGNLALKFHAFQSMVLGAIICILWFLSSVTLCCTGLIGFIIWLYCLYGAFLIFTNGDWRSFAAQFVDNSLMK